MLEKSERPWGRYEVLQEAPNHKVKCIWVSPGKRLSYQSCLLYTSPSPRDYAASRMPSSA